VSDLADERAAFFAGEVGPEAGVGVYACAALVSAVVVGLAGLPVAVGLGVTAAHGGKAAPVTVVRHAQPRDVVDLGPVLSHKPLNESVLVFRFDFQ